MNLLRLLRDLLRDNPGATQEDLKILFDKLRGK